MTIAPELHSTKAVSEATRFVDLLEIADVAFRHWYWPILAAIAVGAAFWVYSESSPRLYRAVALVAMVSDPAMGSSGSEGLGRLGTVASMVGITIGGGTERKAEYVALLSSRRIVAQLIESQKLLPLLFPSAWDPQQQRWKKKSPTVNQAIDEFSDKVLRVTEDRRTGLVTVTVEWFDPELAADWANSLVSMVNTDVRSTTISESKKSIQFLNEELERTREIQVREGLFRLIEANLGRISMANVQDQYALKILDPARAPDSNQHVRPRPLLAAIAGGLLGVIVGLVVILWRNRRRWIV